MAEQEPHQPQHKAAPRPAATTRATAKDATEESEAVKTDNENYVGIDPIYAQSAYEEPLNPEGADVPKDASDEEKKAAEEAAEAEAEMTERVKENEEACVVEVDEAMPFEEWVQTTDAANRKSNISGVDQERVEADREKLEEAKNDDGRIPARSTSRGQPGVLDAS